MKGKTGKPSAMRGGGIARKGVGMALKGGGMARKGTGSNKTPGGTIRKMAGGGETSAGMGAAAKQDKVYSGPGPYKKRVAAPAVTPPVAPPAVNTRHPLNNAGKVGAEIMAAMEKRHPGKYSKPPMGRPGPMPTEGRLKQMNRPSDPNVAKSGRPVSPGPMPTEDRFNQINNPSSVGGAMSDAPRRPNRPGGMGKGSSGTVRQGDMGPRKPPMGRPGPMPTEAGLKQMNPGMKSGGKVVPRKKIAGAKMTAGAGSGSGRIQKVALHKASTRVPAVGLKKGGKLSMEELREYKGGKYMGSPKEERAEKRKRK